MSRKNLKRNRKHHFAAPWRVWVQEAWNLQWKNLFDRWEVIPVTVSDCPCRLTVQPQYDTCSGGMTGPTWTVLGVNSNLRCEIQRLAVSPTAWPCSQTENWYRCKKPFEHSYLNFLENSSNSLLSNKFTTCNWQHCYYWHVGESSCVLCRCVWVQFPTGSGNSFLYLQV